MMPIRGGLGCNLGACPSSARSTASPSACIGTTIRRHTFTPRTASSKDHRDRYPGRARWQAATPGISVDIGVGRCSPCGTDCQLEPMRAKSSSRKDSTAQIAGIPWRVVEVRVIDARRLHVRFADGTEGEVDLGPLLQRENPGVFAALRDPTLFAKVYVDSGAVSWPGGLDLAPDAMYADIKATGRRIVGHAQPS